MAGESFSGLAATARESVGQLLPDADPTKQRLAISSRQEALDIGSGKSKSSMLRYRDAAPLLSRTSRVLRSCYALPGKAAAESWWSHHPSNDNDVMTQMAGAVQRREEMRCDAVALGKCRAREPIARLLAADQHSSIIINGQQSRMGSRENEVLFDLRRQFRGCLRAGPGLDGSRRMSGIKKTQSLGHCPIRSTDLRRSPGAALPFWASLCLLPLSLNHLTHHSRLS